jgi:hypothetical protein
MDGVLLEGQERSGALALLSAFVHNNTHGHKLFARRGNLPNKTNDPWTTFEMDLREPTPIPAAFDFTRFLVSSITFMGYLREVSVYLDDKRLVHLTKDAGTPTPLAIPRHLKTTSTRGFMNVRGLKSTCTQFPPHQVYFVSTAVTFYSPPDHRGCYEMGLQCRNGETQTYHFDRTNQAQGRVFLLSLWVWREHPSTGSFPVTSSAGY